ncbi:hypothetical protein PFISCL1PPCAC_535, partial [Pristionchus fissidentatus]
MNRNEEVKGAEEETRLQFTHLPMEIKCKIILFAIDAINNIRHVSKSWLSMCMDQSLTWSIPKSLPPLKLIFLDWHERTRFWTISIEVSKEHL